MKHYSNIRTLALSILIILTGAIQAQAQKPRMERVHALKVTYISDQLKLNSSEAERFWPVYNRYEDEMMELRQKFLREYRKQGKGQSEEEARNYIEDNLDFQEAMVELKRKYKTDFLKVISAKQIADLYRAEREFKQILIQRLRERRGRR